MNHNSLTIKAYNRYSGGTVHAYHEMANATGIRFSTQFPGGLCASASFFVPIDIMHSWPITVGDRIDISNGLDAVVWQGVLTGVDIAAQNGQTGHLCYCQGYWSYLLMRRNIHKPWADARLDANTWEWSTTTTGADKVTHDNNNRLKIIPKAGTFDLYDSAGWNYIAPTGQTIKRITFTGAMSEGTQAWRIALQNVAGGSAAWSSDSTGTSAVDHTFDPATGTVSLYFQARAAGQVPTADGTAYFGEFTNITVFTETGTITGQTIATYIATITPEISTDRTRIGALTYDLGAHFVADPPTTYADVLTSAAGYGDANYATWAAYVDFSDSGGDDMPRLALQQWPITTAGTADYYISFEDAEVNDSLRIGASMDDVVNYLTEQHQGTAGGYEYATPADDANLVYATGTAAFGRLEPRGALSVNTLGTAAARAYAVAYLARNNWPRYKVSSGLTVTGFIRGAGGERIPASEIRAGRVIRIDNFREDLNGSRPTFVITGTEYDDTSQTCSITVGLPDALPAWLSRQLRKEGKLT